jgi:uncharacterized protein
MVVFRMELALQIVGLKMTGRIEEAKNVGMRIIDSNTNGGHEPSSMTSTGQTSMNNLVTDAEAGPFPSGLGLRINAAHALVLGDQ